MPGNSTQLLENGALKVTLFRCLDNHPIPLLYLPQFLCFPVWCVVCVWWCCPVCPIVTDFLSSLREGGGAVHSTHLQSMLSPWSQHCLLSSLWWGMSVIGLYNCSSQLRNFFFIRTISHCFKMFIFGFLFVLCGSHDVTSSGKNANLYRPGETLSYCNYTWFRLREVSLLVGNSSCKLKQHKAYCLILGSIFWLIRSLKNAKNNWKRRLPEISKASSSTFRVLHLAIWLIQLIG